MTPNTSLESYCHRIIYSKEKFTARDWLMPPQPIWLVDFTSITAKITIPNAVARYEQFLDDQEFVPQ